jgi:hypothetical protein
LKSARRVDDGKFDWMKAKEDRASTLEVQPPHRSGIAATSRKRDRAVSVPDQGIIRGRRPPTLLHNIAEEEPGEAAARSGAWKTRRGHQVTSDRGGDARFGPTVYQP